MILIYYIYKLFLGRASSSESFRIYLRHVILLTNLETYCQLRCVAGQANNYMFMK